MKLKDIVSVTGQAGLRRIVKQRPDGLILSELDGSDKKFMSNRIHMFTPLENISIYTDTDSAPLGEVLWNMKQIEAETPPVSPKANADELKEYMGGVLPEYDRDQVFVSDIKKLIKWYHLLDEHGLIADPADSAADENAGEASEEEGAD